MTISKLILLGFTTVTFCLITFPLQSHAKSFSSKTDEQAKIVKEKLVIMPLRVPEEDKNLTAAMETALIEGLHQKYEVFSGDQVAQKAKEIFNKESRNSAKKECDETRCMQDIAEAFQAELIATANVTKQNGIYFLALNVQNIFDNKVVYSKSLPCKNCDGAQVVDKLKELVGISTQVAVDNAVEVAAAAGKIRLEQLRKAQLDREESLRNADAKERQRLLEAQARDEEEIAKLRAGAESRKTPKSVQNRKDFPTVQSAAAEINRLNERIMTIEAGYKKEVERISSQINQRYQARIDALEKEQKDEFESRSVFLAKQQQRRLELQRQRKNEKTPTVSELAAGETEPLQKFINELKEVEYVLGAESLVTELGIYNSETQQFPIHIRSNNPAVKLDLKASIPLQLEAAKIFKQQWQARLIHIDARVKPGGSPYALALINDADNTHLSFARGSFMTALSREKSDHEESERNATAERNRLARQAIERQAEKDKAFGEMFFPITRKVFDKGLVKEDASPAIKPFAWTIASVIYVPWIILADIVSSPSHTVAYFKVQKEAAYNPSKWAKPNSMLAQAAEFEKQQASVNTASPALPPLVLR